MIADKSSKYKIQSVVLLHSMALCRTQVCWCLRLRILMLVFVAETEDWAMKERDNEAEPLNI